MSMSGPRLSLIRKSNVLRLLLYVVLEGTNLGFAASASSGIPISHFRVSDRRWAKLLFNVVLVLWHTLAGALATEILTGAFSSEWTHHLSKRGHLVPGKSDRVSVLTATVYDHTIHYFGKGASRSFRLGFIATALLFLISSLAPGALRVDSKSIESPRSLYISNVNFTDDDLSGKAATRRAWEIVHSSQSAQTHFGFASQEGWLIPWPDLTSSEKGEGTWIYPSDVVQYRHACQWAAPTLNNDTGEWTAMGLTWVAPLPTSSPLSSMSAIYPLVQHNSSTSNQTLSAFLFLGSNTTLTNTSQLELSLNMTDFPEATFSASGFTFNSTIPAEDALDSDDSARLAMILVCNPQMNVLSGRVSQSGNNTLQVEAQSSLNLLGNFPTKAAHYIFSRGLLDVVSVQEPFGDTLSSITFLASRLFLDPNSHDTFTESPNTPRSLSDLNSQMDIFSGLASKAFLSGYQYTSPWTTPSQNHLSTSATFVTPGLALYSNEPILIASAILVGVTIVLLAVLVFLPQTHSPFTLKTILAEQNSLLSSSRTTSNPIITGSERRKDDVPLMPFSPNRLPPSSGEGDTHKLMGSALSSHQELLVNRTAARKSRSPYLRLGAFVLLELGYIALAGACLRTDGLIVSGLIRQHQRLAKGGFSVIFIFWQILAIFFVQHIVVYAFSTEWYVRFQHTRRLFPRDTDRVSALGSGFIDRCKLFLTRSATWPFRVAFLLSLIFLVISSIASGTIYLDSKSFFDYSAINVGNLTFVGSNGVGGGADAPNVLPLERATSVVKLEFLQHEQFRYSMDEGYLFGWAQGLDNDSAVYRYDTDTVHLNYSCHWDPAPKIISPTDFRTTESSWSIFTSFYTMQTLDSVNFNLTAGVHPLVNNWIPDNSPYFVNTSISAFAIFGENGDSSSLVDLTDIPSTNTTSLSIDSTNPLSHTRYPSRMAIVVCDPNYVLSGGTVELNGTSKHISLRTDGQTRTNNFPEASINVTLSQGILDAMSTIPVLDAAYPYWINNEASQIFFPNSSASPPLHPLNVTAISSHIQFIVISASKGFLDGYTVDTGASDPSGYISTTPVKGESNAREEAVLVTNRAAYIASICLIAIATVLLVLLVILRKAEHEFNLVNVLDALAEQVTAPQDYHQRSENGWDEASKISLDRART